jgi:hypothetical protein
LPWSTCPIVPMFTCGLFRSNFSFDISVSVPGARGPFGFGAAGDRRLDLV